MTSLLFLLALALGLDRKSKVKPESLKDKVIREADEIVDGIRDAFSDDQAMVDVATKQAVEDADRDFGRAPPVIDATPAPRPYAPPPRPAPSPIAPRPSPPVPGPQPAAVTQFPAGYDPMAARRVAPALARHLKNKGRANYDRRLLEDFQRKAGITADRVYGGESAGALLFYGGSDAPPPFFKPLEVVRYVPPEQRR